MVSLEIDVVLDIGFDLRHDVKELVQLDIP